MHFIFDMNAAPGAHPQTSMRELGVKYTHSTPQSMFDAWQFWNCQNIPEPLPEFLRPLNKGPHDYINYGLSAAQADEIVAAAPAG